MEEAEPPQYIVTAPGDETNEEDDDKSSTSTATTKSNATAVNVTKIGQNTRSQSLQSSSTNSSTSAIDQQQMSNTSIMQQSKAQSSMNIVAEKHVQKYSSTQSSTTCTSSSSTSMTGTKSKFTSFLQHPDPDTPCHGSSFLTAQQKHVRQFVRSTSAHSSTDSTSGSITMSGKSDKCIRSASQQIDDDHNFTAEQTKSLQQSAAILISKSAETIEGFRSCSSISGTRTQLTLSGGFLAPPNRKLTILSPIHAPPGLQELLKKHRSPLSPRISFPSSEAELFP